MAAQGGEAARISEKLRSPLSMATLILFYFRGESITGIKSGFFGGPVLSTVRSIDDDSITDLIIRCTCVCRVFKKSSGSLE